MKSLLGEAAAHYDLVIVDTPPVSSCADANALSRYSDGLVMITRPNFTPKEMVLRAVSELKGNGVPILGFVFNGMTTQTEKYYSSALKGYKPLAKPLKRLTDSGVLNNSVRR
jgi:Mrp family chromosome partitioning ATPase